jgi:hypothetical protein
MVIVILVDDPDRLVAIVDEAPTPWSRPGTANITGLLDGFL